MKSNSMNKIHTHCCRIMTFIMCYLFFNKIYSLKDATFRFCLTRNAHVFIPHALRSQLCFGFEISRWNSNPMRWFKLYEPPTNSLVFFFSSLNTFKTICCCCFCNLSVYRWIVFFSLSLSIFLFHTSGCNRSTIDLHSICFFWQKQKNFTMISPTKKND